MVRVLFICVHNSARSQMAEAYLRRFGGDEFSVESAGFEPTVINPLVVAVMAEDGFDLAAKKTRKVFDLYKAGRVFDYVITVCSESGAEGKCPIFPGMTHRLHLPFPDPAAVEGSREDKLGQVRAIRDGIKEKMREFADWVKSGHQAPLGDMWEIRQKA